MNIEDITLRVTLDIPISDILITRRDTEDFTQSIKEGDFDNARIILVEAVSKDILMDAYCDTDTIDLLHNGTPVGKDTASTQSYTY
jgi:hypothetical protein